MGETWNGYGPRRREKSDTHVQALIEAAILEACDGLVGAAGGPFDQLDLFNDLYGPWAYGNGNFIPPYYWQNQKRGEVIPVYLNEVQLRWIRDRQRRLGAENPFMQGAIANVQNYCVGETGLRFEAVPATHREASPSDLRMTQRMLDVWNEANDMPEYARHLLDTGFTNGDAITRHFPQRDGIVLVRPVEAEHLRSPAGDGYGAHYSFGIQTHPEDIEDVQGYWIIEDPLEKPTPVFVPASHITFIKFNTPRSAKRGLPTFYSCEVFLRGAVELLRATMATVTSRAKVALIRKFSGVVKDAAKKLVKGLSTQEVVDPGDGRITSMQKFPYATILNSSEGVEHEFPAQNFETDIHKTALYMVLRAIAVRAVLPEWVMTGDPSSGTYDNAFIAESPSTKSLGVIQETMCRRLGSNRVAQRRSMAWVQVVHAVERGLLPERVLHTVQIKTTGPTLLTRDTEKEAATNKTYVDMRIKPPQQVQAELGIDPKIAEQQWEEWDAREEKRQRRQMAQQQPQPGGQRPGQGEGEGDSNNRPRDPASSPAAGSGGTDDDESDTALQESFQAEAANGRDTLNLAAFYADLWADRPPAAIGDGELATADAELADGEHSVDWDEAARRWRVISPAASLEAALLEASHRAPKGGVTIGGKKFRGGMFIPAKDYAKASAEEKAAIDNPAAAAAAKRKGRDPSKLRDKLQDHANQKLDEKEKAAADRSLRALYRHHGELTAHRLDELTDQVQAELARTPEDQTERRGQLSRQLRAIEHQLSTLDSVAEQQEAKKQEPPKPPNTIYKRIRDVGIELGSIQHRYDINTQFIQSGLLGLLVGAKAASKRTSKPMGLDQWAHVLEEEGYLRLPDDVDPQDYLLDLLKNKALSLHDSVESELERAEAEYIRELKELQDAGVSESEIEEALRAGREEGLSRGAAVQDPEGLGELAGEEGFEGGDVSFDPGEFERPAITADEGETSAKAADAAITFEKNADAHKWAKEQFAHWAAGLSSEERWAVNAYSGGGYESINAELRAGKKPEQTPGKTPDVIKHLDAALEKGAAPKDMTVFRGVRGEFADKLIALAEQGGTITDPSYMSTTLASKQAHEFSRRKGMTNAILEISVPKGTKGAYTDALDITGEAEWLMPRDTTLQIQSAEKDADGRWKVKASVVTPASKTHAND